MAWQLCSKQDVIALIPVAESELKDVYSDMVEALIRQHIGQPHLGEVETVTDEYHDGDGTHILRVKKPPIISVDEVKVSGLAYPHQPDGVSLSADDYVVFSDYIQLKYTTFPKGSLNVVISYTSGSTQVDNVIRLAAASMIVAILNYRRRHGADSSLKWGAAEQKAGEESPNLNIGLTSHLDRIMKRLLRRDRVRVK